MERCGLLRPHGKTQHHIDSSIPSQENPQEAFTVLFIQGQEPVHGKWQEEHTGEGTSSLCDIVVKSPCTNLLLFREACLGKITNYNHTPLYRAASEFRNPIKPVLVDTS